MKVYVVVDACSGEDYSADDPTVLFVSTDRKKAEQFFYDEIENWEDGMENLDAGTQPYNDGTLVYECTDFDGDSHKVMKLVEKEIE